MPTSPALNEKQRAFWLPDFCTPSVIVFLVLLTQVVVLIIFLAPTGASSPSLARFVAITAYAQLIALVSALCLCLSTRWRGPMNHPAAVATLITIPVLVAAGIASLVYIANLGDLLRLEHQPSDLGFAHFVGSTSAISALIAAAAYRYMQLVATREAQIKAHARAQLEALQARIRPHFLFNSLNSLAALIPIDPGAAERYLENLSDLFRAALRESDGDWTVQDEIDLAMKYLANEQVRLGDRLKVVWHLDEDLPLSRSIPVLSLQPLVENAIVHGISLLTQGGELSISAHVTGPRLIIEIINPCPALQGSAHGSQQALVNTQSRLTLALGDRAGIHTRRDGQRFHCTVTIPLD